ncbi:hypothetical protein Tco_1265179 [Tanacetum coccineum]
MLAEISSSKMLLKQKDPMMLEKKVNTTPVDYTVLNKLSQDFETRFVPQTELSTEQAFWSQNSVNSSDPTPSSRPTKVEVPKELPKVSMVNTSLKKLKNHLAGFDVVVKERTTATAITKGLWGDRRMSKLIAENEHLKQTYKQLYDSIKPSRIRSKEQCDDLINQVNLKSAEIYDLNASLQEKVLVITTLRDDLRKLKGKALVDNAVTKHYIDLKTLKFDVEPITLKLLNNRTAHSAYIKHTQEEAAFLRDLNKDKRLDSCSRHISGTENTKTTSSSNLVSNKHVLSSTGVKQSTSASGSQPSGNTKKDKIQQPSSSTLKNKVEAHPRIVKSSLKNKNSVVEPKGTANVQHSKLNANFKSLCVKCNGCMLYDNHDLCVLDFINNMNARNKSKSVKQNSKRKVWKPTGKVFTNIGYIWRPTGRTFTIVGTACPLTRITTTAEVPLRKPTALKTDYSKRPYNNIGFTQGNLGNLKLMFPLANLRFLKNCRPNCSLPLFDELLTPPPSVDCPAPEVIALINESSSESLLHYGYIHTIVHPDHQISKHNSKWTKDHPLENIIGELARPVSTRLQLHEQALFCYYNAFLTAVEPKTYKDALT